MKYKVEVTQADINLGRVQRADCCPLALACQRATGNEYLRVGSHAIYEDRFGYICLCPLPQEVLEFRRTFDAGRREDCKPFSFELELPDREA